MRTGPFPVAVAITLAVSGASVSPHVRSAIVRSGGDAGAAADNGLRAAAERVHVVIREVTAYNVGVRSQTSEFPCIGAMGINLCELVKQGRKVCAANFVELGTTLVIENLGEYVVLDRMNSRFGDRVDIAMADDEIDEAKIFGVQRLAVVVQ